MKTTLPFLLLLIFALGCGKFGPDSSTTSNSANSINANANAASPKIAKLFDLPATIGKSKDEIKKMVTGAPKHEDPWLEYVLPEYELTFRFDKNGKASDATFTFKPIRIGDASISGLETAQQIGTMAGVDVEGKTPKSAGGLADTYEMEIGGKKTDVSFYKVMDRYHRVMITVN
jgi:hypothetical protein